MERVFEIGRVFRNEGIDTRHNPEFTLLEAYQAFADYHDMMELTEALVAGAAQAANGTTVVQVGERAVDLRPPYRRVTMSELVEQRTGERMHPAMPLERARAIAERHGVAWLEAWGSGRILAELYEALCEPELVEPTFVLDHPREISPLARAHREDPELTERFELVVGGRELVNAYSELNDPVDQAERFADAARRRDGGDEEAEPGDAEFVAALECGLPPAGGLGIGVDRLVMLLAGVDSIRDVILFPTLRPADGAAPPCAEEPCELAPALPEEDDAPRPQDPHPVPVTRHPRSLKPLAWLTALVGAISLLPSLPLVDWRFGVGELLERPSRVVTFVISVALGIALIAVSRQIARGRRRAWWAAVALFGAATVVHILKGPHPIPALANLAEPTAS